MIFSNIVFRSMQVMDIPRVMVIDRLSFSMPWPESSYRFELLKNDASRCWVAEIQQTGSVSQVIGIAVVWQVVDQAHIATFAVHPNFRNRGFGSQMLQFILQNAQKEGMLSATLEVRETNSAAQSLYQKFGFKVTGRRVKYYHDTQEDAWIMTLLLPIPTRLSR